MGQERPCSRAVIQFRSAASHARFPPTQSSPNSAPAEHALCTLIPAGYMAKRVMRRPEWLRADAVVDVHSLSGCMSANFAGVPFGWRQNGYWLFNSPRDIVALAREEGTDLSGMSLFYYEVHALEYVADERRWREFAPDPSFRMAVEVPAIAAPSGFDVACFSCGNAAECSPLSCNGLATALPTNEHCLLPTFESAEIALNSGFFERGEPGPYRILSVHLVAWP